MIKLVGFKRVAMVAVLAGLNAAALAAYFFYVSPLLDETTAQLEGLKSEIGQLKSKIDDSKRDVAYVNENLDRFKSIVASGLFGAQDRFEGQRLLEDLRKQGDIYSFNYSVGDMTPLPSPEADSMGFDLMGSKVSVTRISATLDNGFFSFAQGIEKSFPGHTRIRHLDIRRNIPFDNKQLDDIADGKQVELVSADIDFDWITLQQKAAAAAGGR